MKKTLFEKIAAALGLNKFGVAMLEDGREVTFEGDSIAVGSLVTFMNDAQEVVPLEEGTHKLSGDMAGKSIVVDGSGIIQEIIDENPTGLSVEEEKMAALVISKFEALEAKVKDLEKGAENFNAEKKAFEKEKSSFEAERNKFSSDIEKLNTELTSVKEENKKLSDAFAKLQAERKKFEKIASNDKTGKLF